MTLSAHAEAVVSETAAELLPLVKDIEAAPASTKDHYGSYLNILTQCKDEGMRYFATLALLRAGANRDGVLAAAKIVGII